MELEGEKKKLRGREKVYGHKKPERNTIEGRKSAGWSSKKAELGGSACPFR